MNMHCLPIKAKKERRASRNCLWSIYLSIYLSIRPSVCPFVRPPVQPSIHPSACLSIYLSNYLYRYLSIYLYIYRLNICLSVHLSILNSLRWPIYVINWLDNSKLSCYTLPPRQHHSLFRNLPPLFICLSVYLYHIDKATSQMFPSPLGTLCSVNRRQLRFSWNWESYQWLNYLLTFTDPVVNGNKQLCQKI